MTLQLLETRGAWRPLWANSRVYASDQLPTLTAAQHSGPQRGPSHISPLPAVGAAPVPHPTGWKPTPFQPFVPQNQRRGSPLLRPQPSTAVKVGAGGAGRAKPPTWRGPRFRNGLHLSVNGQILACHITGDEKMLIVSCI